MKPIILLLSGLLLSGAAAPPPASVHVTFAPLTKAAYLAAKCHVETKPRTTFPLNKQRGRLIIPTAKGKRIFTDVVIDDAAIKQGHGENEETTYTYLGYLPNFHCHLMQVQFYETTQWLLLSEAGQLLNLWGKPVFAPDGKHIVATCQGIEYGGGQPNILQLLSLQNGTLREVWTLEPKTWEPADICWTSPNTLLLSKEMWTGKNPGTTYAYAKLSLTSGK